MSLFGVALSLVQGLMARPATTLPPIPAKAPPAPPVSPGDDSLLEADLRRDEGLRQKVYRDTVGKQTIGIGHNIDADRRTPEATKTRWFATGMSMAEAYQVLRDDIAIAKAGLDHALPWWSGLDKVRQDALTNMAFNMGIATLLTFKNSLAAAERRDWPTMVDHLDHSKWDGQVHARADRIEHMFLTGARS